jgi:hypothetical protein
MYKLQNGCIYYNVVSKIKYVPEIKNVNDKDFIIFENRPKDIKSINLEKEFLFGHTNELSFDKIEIFYFFDKFAPILDHVRNYIDFQGLIIELRKECFRTKINKEKIFRILKQIENKIQRTIFLEP